jgi:hypothetical protein
MAFDGITSFSCAVSENGNLYVLGKDTLWQINRHNQLAEFPLYTNVKAVVTTPVKFGYTNFGKPIAHIGNNIYQRDDSKWRHVFTLPFATHDGNLSVKDWETIVFTRDDSVFYYNISNGKVAKGNARLTINNFTAAGIQRIIFTHGHYGCFRGSEETQVYTRHDSQFVTVQTGKEPDTANALPDYPYAIDARVVEDFLKKMPTIYSKQVSIGDLAFSQAEYDSCKINILKYKSMYESDDEESYNMLTSGLSDPDFTKFITLVDSVKTIDQELLNWYFISQRPWSTSRLATKITFVNNNNEVLEIENHEYYNALYFPWLIKLNGLYTVNTAIEINQFIQTVYPNFLDKVYKMLSGRRKIDARVYEIQRLVKFLYNER